MNLLERIWELLGTIFGGLLGSFERLITKYFGSSNERYIKRLQSRVDSINALESKYEGMSNEELGEQTVKFRQRLKSGETLDDILVEAFAVCREAGKRFLDMRHYDVQLIGGMVLHSGAIAEMVTGEGKTLVATLPTYLNAIEGKGVHVVTVNDYLARRDMEWMGPLYMGLGLTVGAIQGNMPPADRQKAYACNITYGTNNEFGFDYLRDNMRPAARDDHRFPKHLQQAQGPLNYAVIDEVDNILIDEARTPLIISGPAKQNPQKYQEANRIASQLKKDEHFEVNEKDHSVTLTDSGVRAAEKMAGVESFYTPGNMDWPHMIDNALKAHFLYKRDVNYVVQDGRVIIVDEFTGRLMDGRQWSDGLHQAVESKEGVKIKEETQTLATITLQNFFKLYHKIAGMTGTGMTEAGEFLKIYKLDVVAIPTNREMQRLEPPDAIFSTERAKYEAMAEEIEQVHKWDVVELKDGNELQGQVKSESDSTVALLKRGEKNLTQIDRQKVAEIRKKGRPILVGTVSIEKSERLSELLNRRGIKHSVLNAKFHKREAEIVAQAGRLGAVTIATNMAGRGTDIVLGGNAETMAWAQLQDQYETRLDVPREEWDARVEEIETAENMKEQGQQAKDLGGLHVIGTERHEARRIDLQLRGRCGRQGDPGSSKFFLSLEDDIMRIFAGPWVKKILQSAGWQEGEAIQSSMVSRRIEGAQKKIEERNFEIRKNLLEYDEINDVQRKKIYEYRQAILNGTNCRELLLEMIEQQVGNAMESYLSSTFGAESFAAYASGELSTPLEGKIFRGEDFNSAKMIAQDEAERTAETDILSEIDQNLPDDEEAEWNWRAMADFANRRWQLNLNESQLKKVGRNELAEFLIEKARGSIQKIGLEEGKQLLDPDVGVISASRWSEAKFGVQIEPRTLRDLEVAKVTEMIVAKATEAYDRKEAEYPVMAGMYRFSNRESSGMRMDREALVEWAAKRFDAEITVDDLTNRDGQQIHDLLLEHSQRHQQGAKQAHLALDEKYDALVDAGGVPLERGSVKAGELEEWLNSELNYELPFEEFEDLDAEELKSKLVSAVEDHFHPEMRRMERFVLLEVVDSAWKDHLLSMDYLRSAVGQRGMAQQDPKVEYKREGMRLFDELWKAIGERTTELIFRMEQLDEGFVSSTWVETSARHDAAQSPTSETMQEQQQAIEASQSGGQDQKVEPIRNRQPKVGRNDPCPCGSGKKYKNCCMRQQRDIA